MNYLVASIVYTGFFGCIATACYVTQLAVPLWALLLTPSLNIDGDKNN